MKRRHHRDVLSSLATRVRERHVLVLLSLVLTAIVLGNAFGSFTPDTKPELFLQPAESFRRFALSWLDSPNLGTANYNTGNTPVAAGFAVLEWLGIPPWIVMRLWRLGLLLIAAAGARMVMRELARGASGVSLRVAGVAAAVAYVANPYVIVGAGTTPTMQPYAFLPWLVLCWLRGARDPRWWWASAAAVSMAAMGAINAGVVPIMQLIILLPLFLHIVLVLRIRFLTFAWLVIRTGLIYCLLSAYWLVPAVVALGTGTSVADSTESMEAINMANSFAEVVRGLGMWTLYGAGGEGPFDPGRLAFVTSPVVVLLTFGGPILAVVGARLSSSGARIFASAAVLCAAIVMVGTFSPGGATVWSRALEYSFDAVPGLIAFRTTNKVGGVLELGLAMLIGLAAAEVSRRLVSRLQRVMAVLASGAVVAGSIAPALTGGLFWITMDVPDYWKEAAAEVDSRHPHDRVLLVPGVGFPQYEWGYAGPDEIGSGLFTRPHVYRRAPLPGGEFSGAMLAQFDRRMYLGTLPASATSTFAHYVGASDVVARHDLIGVDLPSGRVEQQLTADPWLSPPVVFGDSTHEPEAGGLVTVRSVEGATRTASPLVKPGEGALVIDGSGAALVDLAETKLLDGLPALLVAEQLSDTQLQSALRRGGRLVLTDSNLRREWSGSAPQRAGPVLPTEVEVNNSRAVLGPEAQSTEVTQGNVSVTSLGQGILFGPAANAGTYQAFDGDLTTAWRVGNFGSGAGNTLVLTPDKPMPMRQITLWPLQFRGQWITTVRITATLSDRTVSREVPIERWRTFPTVVEVSDEPVARLDIEILEVGGSGIGPVGFREIEVPGLESHRSISLPDTLIDRLSDATAQAGVELTDIPIDVVLSRGTGDTSGMNVEESRLQRIFSLPDSRTFAVSGIVRLAADVSDTHIDALAGADSSVIVKASSRAFNRLSSRGAMAVDGQTYRGDRSTAWLPDDPVVGEWISVDFPAQELVSFTITQPDLGSHASAALVSINDGEPFEASLGPGRSEVLLPEPVSDAHRVRVLITQAEGEGLVRFENISLPRMNLSEPMDACLTIGWIDRQPIRARFGGHLPALLAGEPVPLTPCNTITLEPGSHQLIGEERFAIDLLHLSGAGQVNEPPSVRAETQAMAPDRIRLSFPEECSGCLVSSGQGFDRRWRAILDGVDLGPPIVLNGYSAGWQVDVAAGSVIEMEFGPRRLVFWAWWISSLGLIGAGVVLIRPALLRMLRGRRVNEHTG